MLTDSEEFKFAGISTFMRAPYVSIDSLEGFDVGILGIPLDYGTSYRQGAKDGPRSIREHSHWDRVDGSTYVDLNTSRLHTSNNLRIADLGDIHITPSDPEKTNHDITAAVREIRQRTFPLILGGDHSITYASFRGCAEGLNDAQKPLGLLHFDAHPDVEKGYLSLPRVWHGNPFRMLIDEGYLKGEHMVTIGPRGLIAKQWFDYSKDKRITMISAPETIRRGVEATIQTAIQYLRDRCAAVYVSFDIDCLDPADAPGTGTPSVGGLRAAEVIPAMRMLRELPVAGFDLTEVAPHLDPSGRTMVVANDLLWNFLSFGLKQ